MVMIQLNSSCFQSLGYDRQGQELQLNFKSGKAIKYMNVSVGLVRRMLRAKSAGKFLQRANPREV